MRAPGSTPSAEEASATLPAHTEVKTGIGVVFPLYVLLPVFLWLYWDTASSMVAIWWRSPTFAHGFLILPISLWLLWRKRAAFANAPAQPSYWGALAILLLGLSWRVADIVGLQFFEQFLMVCMVPALIWALQGWQRLKTVAFPVGFLLFAVPVGEFLIPPLIDFTAAFTVMALRMTGLPVYMEGNLLILPTGTWSVEYACSGVRYLIASVTLGFLYAYLAYHSLWRRLWFIAASAVVPILANGLRAYTIVMIGHLSDMRLAVGVDHFIYGWVFFGIVMTLLFWIGSFWLEETPPPRPSESHPPPIHGHASTGRFIKVSTCALIGLSIWPGWARLARGQETLASSVDIGLPESIGSWRASGGPLTSWRPRFVGMDAEQALTYESELGSVGLYLAYYRSQQQGAEMVSSVNGLIDEKTPWWALESGTRQVPLGDDNLEVRETRLRSTSSGLLVWQWYWIDGSRTTGALTAKLLEARAKLVRRSSAGASIVVYQFLERTGSEDISIAQLTHFLEEALPAIEAQLESAPR